MIMTKKLDGRAVHKTNQILTTFLINPPTLHSTGVRHTCPSFQSRTRALPSRAASACAGEQAQTHTRPAGKTSPPSSLDHATQAPATSIHTKNMPGASRFGKAVKYISLFPIAYLSLLAGA